MDKNLRDKSYRLTDDRSGESFLLKSGRDKNLVIFDKDKKYNRAIRHCPNEKSIYIDEQSEHALVAPIIFSKGFLEVPYTQQNTQNFLDRHPDNVLNGGSWFEEIDDEAEAIEDIEYEELIMDIKQEVRDKATEEDGIYALEMVVSILLNSVQKAGELSKEELKRVIYQEAEKNPEYFTDGSGNITIFDNEVMQRKYITLRAIKDGIIKKSPNNKSIVWGKDSKKIYTAPQGVDLVESFADYLSSDDGIIVLEEIKKRS